MCTALSFKHENSSLFGRNMDLAWNFNQAPMFIPRNATWLNRADGKRRPFSRAIIGMGTLIDEHPSMAEAMNENGLACAGLNFPGYAHWESACKKDKYNLTPYDFILWVLSEHDTVEQLKNDIPGIELVDIPINAQTPCPTLHWMISDKSGACIVVEKTADAFKVHDNPVSVMTNNPCFDWHLTNLCEYMGVRIEHPENVSWGKAELSPLGVGAGSRGIPGDFASVSRFVRTAFANTHLPEMKSREEAVGQCFHMLDYAAMVKGCVKTAEGIDDLTLYSVCMDLGEGIYYYKNWHNSRISAIDMRKEDYGASEIKLFPYPTKQDICYMN